MGEGRGEGKQAHSAVLAYPRQQLVDAVDTLGQHNQRFAEGNGVAQAFMAHGVVLDSVDIRDVRQPDAAADQFAAAEANRVGPDFLQKGGSVAGVSQGRVAGFLRRQRLEAFGEGGPQLVDIVQPLFARGGGVANTELARQAQ